MGSTISMLLMNNKKEQGSYDRMTLGTERNGRSAEQGLVDGGM